MKKVLLFLANGFEILEASAFIDVIGWNYLEGDGSTKLFSCGFHKEVKSSFDQKFIVDYTLDEIDPNDFDALAIPGGFEEYDYYTEAFDDRFLQLIRAFDSRNKTIASICVASLAIAKSGLLKGKEGTTYNSIKRRDILKSFGVNIIDQAVVKTDNIITSYGPSTATEVSFILLELLTSKINADQVKKLMGFNGK